MWAVLRNQLDDIRPFLERGAHLHFGVEYVGNSGFCISDGD